MASIVLNALTAEEILYLQEHPKVLEAKACLVNRNTVYFSVPVNQEISNTLQNRFGVTVAVGAQIPMRWIKGDTAPHVDVGAQAFESTFLLYLNDSPGELVVDTESYPIQANTAFQFNEGLRHETRATGDVPRLLLGPMNELAQTVGLLTNVVLYYYDSLEDALQEINEVEVTNNTIVGYTDAQFTSWRIASNSTGTSSQSVVYKNGDFLDAGDGYVYYLYPAAPCFLEGTAVLCEVDGIETYVPVEKLQRGTLVKTSLNGFQPVALIGHGILSNPGHSDRTEHRLYKCTPSKYPDLTDDLFITGCHSILEFPITNEQKDATLNKFGKLYVTDKKYRLMACVDERAEPWASEGRYTIWHFALEHSDEGMNYGVYVNGGLLVESCSLRFLKTKSNMTLA
jgi:hypothetical protein